MSDRRDLRELVGDDVPADELGRLQRVHDLLVAVGPPPELSPELEQAPVRRRPVVERRRWGVLALAATLVVLAFVGGAIFGRSQESFDTQFALDLRGVGQARAAVGTLEVGERDDSGNWPMLLRVRGLRELAPRGYYEVLLTRKGKRSLPCGTFIVQNARGTTTVYLNAPYDINRDSTWVIAVHPRGHIDNPPVVMEPVT